MDFLETLLFTTLILVISFIGFPVVIYILIPVAIRNLEFFANFPNTSSIKADETKIRKARMVCIAVYYGFLLAWWFVDYLWGVLVKIYEPGGW